MLERIDEYLKQWREPIWDGLYRRQEGVCRQLMEQAWEAWRGLDADEGERQAVGIYLEYLEHEIEESFSTDPEHRAELIRETLHRLSREAGSWLAEIIQARVLLSLRSWAHVCGVLELARADVDRLWAKVPPEDIDHQTWSYLGMWAFSAGQLDYLKKGYRYFVTQPVDFLRDFSRQRFKVMIALREERCQRRDLERLIELTPHLRHAQWLGRNIAAFCTEHGLWDDGLTRMLDDKVRSLRYAAPQTPLRTKPEGHLHELGF